MISTPGNRHVVPLTIPDLNYRSRTQRGTHRNRRGRLGGHCKVDGGSGPGSRCTEDAAVPTPETTAFSVLVPGLGPSVHSVLACQSASVLLVSRIGGSTATAPTTQLTGWLGIGLPS